MFIGLALAYFPRFFMFQGSKVSFHILSKENITFKAIENYVNGESLVCPPEKGVYNEDIPLNRQWIYILLCPSVWA